MSKNVDSKNYVDLPLYIEWNTIIIILRKGVGVLAFPFNRCNLFQRDTSITVTSLKLPLDELGKTELYPKRQAKIWLKWDKLQEED
ncbi:hypothetical protein D0469_03640 [Peribacillus saganii]|uniref:Uncharacterized protein n=1 Tax=Peribacillus saganii TaxID=2303992 RepID=A0A372LS89_9BACI|nr:hypothetical protein D0469_03640 [Peribacillus saganii]